MMSRARRPVAGVPYGARNCGDPLTVGNGPGRVNARSLPCHSGVVNQMNPLRRTIGLVLIMIGGFWFFMGIGVIDGSVLSGQTFGTVLGVIFVLAGVLVLVRAPKGPAADPEGDEGTDPDPPAAT